MSDVLKGTTDVVRYVMIVDSTTGAPETGITVTTLDMQYTRELSAAAAKVDAIVGTGGLTTHVDNKIAEVDATSSPGLYMVCWPDAAFVTGANKVQLVVTGTGFAPAVEEVPLVNFNSQDGVRLGLTALPNAVADAAGGLAISDAGGLDIDGLATAAALATVDTEVGDIQTDLDNATDGLGALKTLIDTVNTDLSNGTDGLGALKTLIDAVNTDLSNGTDGLGALKTLIDALNDLSAANINAEVVDVLKTDTITQLTQAAPPAAPTFEEALMYLYQYFRNKREQSAVLSKMYDDAGTTVIAKATLNDDGTDFTKEEFISGA